MTMTQQYFDARGRPADETEALDHGILRDGYRLRTSMLALDSLQRAVAEFADRKRRLSAIRKDASAAPGKRRTTRTRAAAGGKATPPASPTRAGSSTPTRAWQMSKP